MQPLAERVLSRVRRDELLSAGDRAGVAVSGGIDSVALLRVLLELRGELGIVLSVVHFNHRLRGAESDADQEFVAGLARGLDLEFHVDGEDVGAEAAEDHVSIETAARELRYGFFRYLLESESKLNKIVTGHTLDDQAETVLMRMIRGAGLRGLGGIHPRILVEDDEGGVSGEIVRPLLGLRHRELENYLSGIGQTWREDSTNTDQHFTRNRVRKLVVPLLEREFNPAVAENLAELAEIARGEEDYWENEVSGWLGTVVQWVQPEWARAVSVQKSLVQIAGLGRPTSGKSPTSRTDDARELGHPEMNDLRGSDLRAKIDSAPWAVMNASVPRMWFLGEPVAVQRRLVKAIGENAGIPLEFKHVEEIVRVAAEETSGKEVSLPLGWRLVVEPEELAFVTPDLRESSPQRDYEYQLPIAGEVVVHEAGFAISLQRIPSGDEGAYNPDHLLDAESLPGPLRVRNWRPGDRFWPAHTKSPKKIKELLQDRHVAQPARGLWPVVVSGDDGGDDSGDQNGYEIVWMRGFPVPAKLRAKSGRAAILIVEKSLAEVLR
jgi:tRNA(Ile)-lysidine synthase